MLRASSLGLRWYSHTLHPALLRYQWGALHSRRSSTLGPHTVRVVPAPRAVRAVHGQPMHDVMDGGDPPDVKEGGEDTAQKESEEEEEEWFQWTPRQPEQPHYPWGNRLGPSVSPLSVRLWAMSKSKGTTQNSPGGSESQAPSTVVGLATLAEAEMAEYEESIVPAALPTETDRDGDMDTLGMRTESLPGGHLSTEQPDVTHWPEICPVSTNYPTLRGERHAFLLDIISNTPSVTDAWNAYHELANMQLLDTGPSHAHLHRLAALVAHVRPRTRALFIRLISVLAAIKRAGGEVYVWEWNALIDYAGKGFRRTRQEDFQSALDIYEDMVNDRPPGASLNKRERAESRFGPNMESEGRTVLRPGAPVPDVVTLSTLLHLAIRTQDSAAVDRVYTLFKANGIAPNRISYLMLIDFYSHYTKLSEVQRLLSTMRWEGHELGLDGLNNVMWAYAKNARFTVANCIYSLLKHNLVPDSEQDVQSFRRRLSNLDILVRQELVPDHATYMIMLQSYCYQGQFRNAIRVFADMILDIERLQKMADGRDRAANPRPMNAAVILEPAYRAIFLGFYRWGRVPPAEQRAAGPYKYSIWHSSIEAMQSDWTLDAFQALFDDYMTVPNLEANQRVIFWMLMTVARITGNDRDKLRIVYEQLSQRFQYQWGSRLQELKKWIDGESRA